MSLSLAYRTIDLYSFALLFRLEDVEGIELLRWEDQQKIRKYVEGGGPQNPPPPVVMESGIEVSQTSRATCRCCNEKIMKGQVCEFAYYRLSIS